jgi:hypothetical protein
MRVFIPFEGAYYLLLPSLTAFINFLEAFASGPSIFPGGVTQMAPEVFNKLKMRLKCE